MPDLTRLIIRGPHKGKLCTVAHEDPETRLLYARVAATPEDPAPAQFDHKIKLQPFTASWLQRV